MQVWGPILVGVGMAIWKATTGTLAFDNIINIMLSLVLVVMPLTWYDTHTSTQTHTLGHTHARVKKLKVMRHMMHMRQ